MRNGSFFAGVFFLFISSFLCSYEESRVFFSSDDLLSQFIQQVKAEKNKICLASYRLSNLQVIRALLEAKKRGVHVEVVVDETSFSQKSPLFLLEKEGISTFIWRKPSFQKKRLGEGMRHVFCIFGEECCWVGSYGFSSKQSLLMQTSALLLQNKEIVKKYFNEFQMLKKRTLPLSQYVERKK